MFRFARSIAMHARPSPVAEKNGTAAGSAWPDDVSLKSLKVVGSWSVEMSTWAGIDGVKKDENSKREDDVRRELTNPLRMLAVHGDEALAQGEVSPISGHVRVAVFKHHQWMLLTPTELQDVPQKLGSSSSTNTPRGTGYCI